MATHLGRDARGDTVQAIRPGTVQTVSVTGTSAAVSSAFAGHVIRVVSTTPCHFVLGSAPTATTSHSYLPAFTVEYLAVKPGEKIAFIQNAASGTAYVTEGSE